MFDQRVSHIAVLAHAALTIDDDGRVSLALSGTPVRLREPLAGLALEVADDAAARGSAWLFPSSQGNRPLSPDRLRERVAALGLRRVLLTRNGAVGVLATQLPPALLADQIPIAEAAEGSAGWVASHGCGQPSWTVAAESQIVDAGDGGPADESFGDGRVAFVVAGHGGRR
ncbi:hypothetical protein [Micromonospora globispora]|uniref:hypothetical protein n=1 Tax=Micromonospora globispora TaxID=1450148 RepID=UPI000F50B89F|nr:hypothetical protein [Micromonospora globispora]